MSLAHESGETLPGDAEAPRPFASLLAAFALPSGTAGIPFDEARRGLCRWPYDGPGGMRCCGVATAEGESYCREHAVRAAARERRPMVAAAYDAKLEAGRPATAVRLARPIPETSFRFAPAVAPRSPAAPSAGAEQDPNAMRIRVAEAIAEHPERSVADIARMTCASRTLVNAVMHALQRGGR